MPDEWGAQVRRDAPRRRIAAWSSAPAEGVACGGDGQGGFVSRCSYDCTIAAASPTSTGTPAASDRSRTPRSGRRTSLGASRVVLFCRWCGALRRACGPASAPAARFTACRPGVRSASVERAKAAPGPLDPRHARSMSSGGLCGTGDRISDRTAPRRPSLGSACRTRSHRAPDRRQTFTQVAHAHQLHHLGLPSICSRTRTLSTSRRTRRACGA